METSAEKNIPKGELMREEMLRQWYSDTLSNDDTIKRQAEARLGLQIRFRELKASKNKAKEARDECKRINDDGGLEAARKILRKLGHRYGQLLLLAQNGMPSSTRKKKCALWVKSPLSLEQLLDNVALDGFAEFSQTRQFRPENSTGGGAEENTVDYYDWTPVPLVSKAKIEDADRTVIKTLACTEVANEKEKLWAFAENNANRHDDEATMGPHHSEADMVGRAMDPRLAAQLERSSLHDSHSHRASLGSNEDNTTSLSTALENMDFLLPSDSEEDDQSLEGSRKANQIQHAPLVGANIISSDTQHLLPQYGLLASHDEAGVAKSKLLLNTNVPFSIFVCGVQGSGKSHTTSCILENSLLPSKNLGKLQHPLSALVFSYGQFSGDGVGFNVSEAAFLAAPNPGCPGAAHVKRIHVLVAPSNYVRISKLYQKLPNVSVTPFKINSWKLDIDTMLTLMNVSESDETPLYMAQVTQILRDMSTAGGPFNYKAFKLHLKKQKFNPAQNSMLQMRLNLLESFLDTDSSCLELQFQPGEITIMDMSCPFVDANTACILFRIGLQQYLQSEGTGKMIVLDEAHKYMIKVPGARSLNQTLLQTIRLQRHYGARVIISTQEPTLLTDLIALCSITVIHRFSSPEWFSAIKRHIHVAAEDSDGLLRRIESLTTGKAILYSPNSVFGYDDCGNLVTGTSRMIPVSIRRRITRDGGHSVLAV